ncbi:hypothetical protein [Bradyrhizobium sp. URHC0002]
MIIAISTTRPIYVRFKPPRLWSAFITLTDAAKYTAKLPEALIPVAESGGPAILARIGGLRGVEPQPRPRVQPTRKDRTGPAQTQLGSAMTVFVHANTCKPTGDVDHIKVFANQAAAETYSLLTLPLSP